MPLLHPSYMPGPRGKEAGQGERREAAIKLPAFATTTPSPPLRISSFSHTHYTWVVGGGTWVGGHGVWWALWVWCILWGMPPLLGTAHRQAV